MYTNLCNTDNVYQDSTNVIYAAMYYNWDRESKEPDFTASVYDVKGQCSASIMFITRTELLGYLVSDMSIESYGKENVLGVILAEMTWMGFDESVVNGELEQLREQANEIELGDTQYISNCLTDLGYDRNDLMLSGEEEEYSCRVLQQNAAIRDTQIAAIRAQLAQCS